MMARDRFAFRRDGLGKVWGEFDFPRAVLEKWIPFEKEVSVMVARGADGAMAVYDVAENVHREHVLDYSIVPAES